MENLLLILQRAISEEKKKSSFSLQSLLYIRVHSEISVWWSTALILWPTSPVQMRGRTHVIHFAGCWSTTLPQQLSSFSSFYGTHGIPRHKHKLEIDQEMSSVSSFLQCREKKKKSGMHLTGAFEHAQKICAILCFCYLGFSKIRDVTRCRC